MIYIIAGPTCSGKTELAELFSLKNGSEIISADSLSVYRYADIGTSKPSNSAVSYHLLDILDPDQEYNAFDFVRDSTLLCSEMERKHIDPVISGGTILYIDSFLNGLPKIELISPKVKQKVAGLYEKGGLKDMLSVLEDKDPEMFRVIDRNNPRRVMRAAEVILQTGRKYSDIRKERSGYQGEYRFLALLPVKELLVERIKQRTKKMLLSGLVEETEFIMKKYGSKVKLLGGIGYKETVGFLEKRLPQDDLELAINKSTFAYAKRQITFLGRMKSAEKIVIDSYASYPNSIIRKMEVC